MHIFALECSRDASFGCPLVCTAGLITVNPSPIIILPRIFPLCKQSPLPDPPVLQRAQDMPVVYCCMLPSNMQYKICPPRPFDCCFTVGEPGEAPRLMVRSWAGVATHIKSVLFIRLQGVLIFGRNEGPAQILRVGLVISNACVADAVTTERGLAPPISGGHALQCGSGDSSAARGRVSTTIAIKRR